MAKMIHLLHSSRRIISLGTREESQSARARLQMPILIIRLDSRGCVHQPGEPNAPLSNCTSPPSERGCKYDTSHQTSMPHTSLPSKQSGSTYLWEYNQRNSKCTSDPFLNYTFTIPDGQCIHVVRGKIEQRVGERLEQLGDL
jgi:hypothetical protein